MFVFTRLLPLFYFLFFFVDVIAQSNDTLQNKLKHGGDFRFRVEQDWDSRKSDGTYRDDRTRFRYRIRYGFNYDYNKHINLGFRIRTGYAKKQQDPHLTLGTPANAIQSSPLSIEKAYFNFEKNRFSFWLGKNTFPFEKHNELFWSDNVYPEGMFVSKALRPKNSLISALQFNLGHFVLTSNGQSLSHDSYLQGGQIYTSFWKERIHFFPSFYFLKHIDHIPDGYPSFQLDYSIFHVGIGAKLFDKPLTKIELDAYHNLSNLEKNDSIPPVMQDQKNGYTIAVKIGKKKNKGDLLFQLTYAYIQRYSIVDYMAQNDWVRWDYSFYGSPDGRISNFQGFEGVINYVLNERISLKFKYFTAQQLIPQKVALETGSRVRLDLNVTF